MRKMAPCEHCGGEPVMVGFYGHERERRFHLSADCPGIDLDFALYGEVFLRNMQPFGPCPHCGAVALATLWNVTETEADRQRCIALYPENGE